MIQELRTLAVDASLLLPRRGAEIGGLLWGRFAAGDRSQVWIDAMEEVPCEHRYGPSYTLSDEDRAGFRQMLARPRPEGSPEIVGFFRSYTRRDAAPDAADSDLFQTFIPDERAAFFLIEPLSPAECFGTFLFRTGGQLPERSPYAFFSLDPEPLQPGEETPKPMEEAAPLPAAPVAEPVVAREPVREPEVEPEPAPPPRRPAAPFALPSLPPSRRVHAADSSAEFAPPPPPPRRSIWLPLVTCVALAVAAALGYEFWKMAREPQWAQMHLDAANSGGQIQLSWDRTAPAVVLASGATLAVKDGGEDKRIELTADDLHQGRLTYRPSHPDVLFRMDLHSARVRPWSDSIRVLSVAAPVGAPVAPVSAPKPEPQGRASVGEASRSIPAPAPAVEEPPASSGRVVPAVAIHEVKPHIPAGILTRIEDPLIVPVEVKVNASGRVVSAVAKTGGNSVQRYLADAAAKAARSWRFTPARSGRGKAVASTKTIEFSFVPGGR